MKSFNFQLKKRIILIFITFLLLISSIFLFSHKIEARSYHDQSEKQLRVFQLSYALEKEDSFPRQNAYFNNALNYMENMHLGSAIEELGKIEYNSLYIPLYLKSRLLKAHCYEKLERWEAAIILYQNLLKEVPLLPEYVLYLLGRAYQQVNDTFNARKSFLEIINRNPESGIITILQYQLALLDLENGLWEEFWQEGYTAAQNSPEDKFKAKVLTKVSDVLWEKGELVTSLLYLKEIIENRYEKGKISFQENLFLSRFQVLKQQNKIEIPVELLLFFADTLYSYRRFKVAETIYEEIIEKYGEQIDLAQVYYQRARAIYYQGEYERALQECLNILERFDQEEVKVKTLFLYAGGLLSTGNRDRAAEQYQKIITSFPESSFAPLSYLRLSEIEFLQDRKVEGISFLKQLLNAYPESATAQEAAWKLARYYTNNGFTNEALFYYQFIYQYFPQSNQTDDALYWMGKLTYADNRAEGLKWYEKLLNQFPDSYYSFQVLPEVRDFSYNLENLLAENREISLSQFKEDYFPLNKSAQLSVYKIEILNLLELYEEAALEIHAALKHEPNNAYLQFLLIQAYAQAGEYYLSNSYAQTLLNYFLSIDAKGIPIAIWEYSFPLYYREQVRKSAANFHLDPFLVWSIIREESHYNPGSESRAGARGLMQIIPSTGEWIAEKLSYQEFEYDFLFEPELNINFGCWYLQYLQERFSKNEFLVISGYNAGPCITQQWIDSMDMKDKDVFVENIPYQETSEHIKKVMRSYLIYHLIYKN